MYGYIWAGDGCKIDGLPCSLVDRDAWFFLPLFMAGGKEQCMLITDISKEEYKIFLLVNINAQLMK